MSWLALFVLTNVLSQHPAAPSGAVSCGDPLGFQVLLDRNGFSPGEIDGRPGENTKRALSAFQAAEQLSVTGAPDCEAWKALGGGDTETTTKYTITAEEAAGPFVSRIPAELVDQAKLPALRYRSLEESVAERFHASPTLLARLNRGVRYAAGASVVVPNVRPFDAQAKPVPDSAAGPANNITLEVTKEGTLRVLGMDGRVLHLAPVSSGSEHDPLPIGEWKVTSVNWMPAFHYNPELFWDAAAKDSKATIKPGPNNPVGVVWIDITVEHYGLHGTPEPSRIGYAQSHGCVRMTNWDAARVAALVGPGTRVVFK